MRYLFVTTFPPTHCGIGTYASQSVSQLREQGHWVDTVSPDGAGNVDFAWDLRGGWKILKLLKLLPFYDRVVIQYHWSFFYRNLGAEFRSDFIRTTVAFLLLWAMGRRKIEVVAHEIPYLARGSNANLGVRLYRWKWRFVPRLVLHTPQERDQLVRHYALPIRSKHLEIRTHHAGFRKFREITREVARQELGLPGDSIIFLCIGFIQHHKGFDRAIAAFRKASPPGARLYVVGSLRLVYEETLQCLATLHALAKGSAAVEVVDRYLTDEEFDTWVCACDWVVLPYREIWSSSVLGRAHLHGKPSIVSRVGGIPGQARDSDVLFDTDEELVAAFEVCTAHLRSLPTAPLPPPSRL